MLRLIFVMLAAAAALGQETRSMIYGRIVDPQNAAIAGASVAVRNVDTNVSTRLSTNETGYYEANLLLPGNYEVSAEAAGFQKLLRGGITLPLSTRMEINLELQVGSVSDTVTVTAEAPILDTSTVSSGRVMDNRTLMDIPVIGSNATVLVKFTPGMQTSGVNNWLGLHSNVGNSDYFVAGNVGGNEWSVDGVPNNGGSRQVAYMPHTDVVQEFKVETSNFDASIGHTTGAGVTMMTRSGTNDVHGTGTFTHFQQRWNGSPFFVKQLYYRRINEALTRGDNAQADALRKQDKQAHGHENNWSATVGGPIVIPKLVNGRNRLFFFFSYNAYKDIRSEEPTAINHTVPTMANRAGDFSQLLNVDAGRYQIYDPLSVRPDPARATHYIRDPIPGNILPAARMVNPVYQAYAKLYPTPNNDPLNPRNEPARNYLAVNAPLNFEYRALSNRNDYQHSERHRFFARWSWNDYIEDRGDWTYETARGLHSSGQYRKNRGATIDWVFTRGASTVFDFAVAGNEYQGGSKQIDPFHFKPSDVGFPAYLDQKAGGQPMLPQMTISGYTTVSRGYPTITRYRMLTGKADVSHIRGSHTMRAGVDARQHFRAGGGGGNTSGAYTFNNNFTRRNDDGFTPAGDLGHSWAAFLMGIPSGMSIATNDSFATHSPYYAAFFQDNWRLTPKLSLNIGLRLEYELGATERYNRALAWFDPAATLPVTGAAQAAYARSPIPELPAQSFVVAGGSLYAGPERRRLWRNELMPLPRAAAAYQWDSKTVLRGGYGVFYDTLNVLNEAPDQTGFSRTTNTTLTNDFGVNWLAGNPRNGVSPLSDPFPVRGGGARFDAPTRDALGLMAKVGRGWSFIDYNRRHARQQRWRIGLQRQLSTNMVIDLAYAGTAADRVQVARSMSPLPERYWADGLVRNDAIANNLNANVTNPFHIRNFESLRESDPLVYQDMSTNGFFTSATIRKSSLLRAFPQMNGITNNTTADGKVRTDELQIAFERRFSKGFNLNVGYTRLRSRSYTYTEEFDAMPTWRSTYNGRPHRLVGSGVFELPFGKQRKWLRQGLPAALAGGFQIAATYEFQPGALLTWGNYFYNGDPQEILNVDRTLDRWFNTAGFERTAAKGPNSFHRRVFPEYIYGLRADMTNQWNVNVQRDFRIKERYAVQVRVDAINLQNRSQFAAPNQNPYSTDFGRITAQSAALNRLIQLQGRIRF
jgi:hypothetical protein